MKLKKFIQIICLVLFALFAIDAQEQSKKQTERPLAKETVTRENLSSPIFVNSPSKVSSEKLLAIEGIKIQTKFHKFTKRQYFDLVESCDIKNDGLELAYNEWDYLLDGFTSYEINGKVFAYQANFWLVQAEDGYEIGAGVLPIYVDEDGNGKFKLRCDDKTDLESLPEWVKSYKSSSAYDKSLERRRNQLLS